MIVQPLKSAVKGTRSFSTSRSIPQEHRPIEGKMIVLPLKSALEGIGSSPHLDRLPEVMSQLRGR
jgi:hypothetical protein